MLNDTGNDTDNYDTYNGSGPWVIVNRSDCDDVTGEPLCWSNRYGWVTVVDATRFDDCNVNFPYAPHKDLRWEKYEDVMSVATVLYLKFLAELDPIKWDLDLPDTKVAEASGNNDSNYSNDKDRS